MTHYPWGWVDTLFLMLIMRSLKKKGDKYKHARDMGLQSLFSDN